MSKKSEFFVKIENPANFRRTLLGASKDAITTLKGYEDFKKIRIQKIEQIVKLNKIMDDLTLLLAKLKETLPSSKVRAKPAEKKVVAKPKLEKPKTKTKKFKRQIPKSKMTADLEEIEARLKGI